MPSRARKIAFVAMFTSLAIIMGYVERLIPFDIGVQGIKLGLSNIVVLTAMYTFGAFFALCVSMIKAVLTAFLFGNATSLAFSIGGALLSFCVMMAAKKTNFFSVCIVSMLGGIFHNIGQLFIAALLMHDWRVIYYMSVLLISGSIAGFITGIAADRLLYLVRRMKI